jgi:ABC-type branched-subunit amino acid transport system substrate-binding protein
MGFVTQPAVSQERSVKIAGFGARSGVVRSFGVNTEAVMRAAADQVNKSGGVKLGDGSMGKIEISFDDDRCNAEEGISVLRRIASTDADVAVSRAAWRRSPIGRSATCPTKAKCTRACLPGCRRNILS